MLLTDCCVLQGSSRILIHLARVFFMEIIMNNVKTTILSI